MLTKVKSSGKVESFRGQLNFFTSRTSPMNSNETFYSSVSPANSFFLSKGNNNKFSYEILQAIRSLFQEKFSEQNLHHEFQKNSILGRIVYNVISFV